MTYHSIFMWLFNILCLYIASDLSMACQLQVNAPLNSCSNHVASCSTLLLVLRSRFDILYMRHMWLFIVPIRGDLVMVPCLRHDLPLNIQVAAQHMVCLYCVSILRLISIAPRAGKNFGRLGGGGLLRHFTQTTAMFKIKLIESWLYTNCKFEIE